MGTIHVVKQGECLSRIATLYGFADYREIYDHPSNASFRQKRPNPNLIYPGDEVSIPNHKTKVYKADTGRVHTYVVQVQKRKLRLALRDVDRVAMANEPCVVDLGGKQLDVVSDSNGIVEVTVPPRAEDCTVTARGYEWPLKIGHLNPIDDTTDRGISGLQARLRNMGFDPGNTDGIHNAASRGAVRAFQLTYGLDESGEFDQETRSTIVEQHGV